jgi:hypothetical protein
MWTMGRALDQPFARSIAIVSSVYFATRHSALAGGTSVFTRAMVGFFSDTVCHDHSNAVESQRLAKHVLSPPASGGMPIRERQSIRP